MVVVVDDDVLIAKIIEVTLKGIECKCFDSFSALCSEPEESLKRADLVITDMVLEGNMSGLDVRNYMKGINPDVIVMRITGGAGHGEDGFVKTVSKPFNVLDLRETVEGYLYAS